MTPRRDAPTPPPDLWDRPDMATALAERDMGQVLKIYQRWTGASQTQLAQMIDVGQPTISGVMSGKRRVESLALFERFTSGLSIPPERLGLAPVGIKEPGPKERTAAAFLPRAQNAVEHGAEHPVKSATAVDFHTRLSGADLGTTRP
jgi:hypothetical protein